MLETNKLTGPIANIYCYYLLTFLNTILRTTLQKIGKGIYFLYNPISEKVKLHKRHEPE